MEHRRDKRALPGGGFDAVVRIMPLIKFFQVFLFAVAIFSTAPRVYAQFSNVPHDIGSDDIQKISAYQKGQVITFYSPQGDLIQATFVGQISGGSATESARFQVEDWRVVAPTGTDGSPQSGPSVSSSGSSDNTSATGALAGAALVGIGAYIAIPPSLQNELKEGANALQAAINDGRITIQKYQTTLQKSVAGAEVALHGLRELSQGREFEAPAPLGIGAPIPIPEFPNAPEGLRQSLVSSYVVLSTSRAFSVAHAEIRAMGLHAVASAQGSLRSGQLSEASAAAQVAHAAAVVMTQAADLLIAFNPVTSMARDAIELITGKDLLSGRSLSEGEMWMRGLSLGVSLVSAGVGSTVAQSIASIAPMIDEANGLRKMLERTLDITPHLRGRWWKARKALGVADTDHAMRDVAFEAITRGKPYWDVKNPDTVAFFIRTDKEYLRYIIDVRRGRAVNAIPEKLTYSFPAGRWILLDDVPLKSTNGNPIKLFLPGGGPP